MIYVNGVNNDVVQATNYATIIASWMHATVTPVLNPSRSVPYDSMQTVGVNKTNTPDETTHVVVKEIRREIKALSSGEYLGVVGHSQGGAVVSSALSNLSDEERRKIDAITIGGAACSLPFGLHSITVYINTRDVVPMTVGAHPGVCRARLLLQETLGTYVDIRYYTFGTPLNFAQTHGVDKYRDAALSRTPSKTARESESQAIGRMVVSTAVRTVTRSLFWVLMGTP